MKRRILMRAGKSPFVAAGPARTLGCGYTLSNVGNLLFQHAIYRHVYDPQGEIDVLPNARPEQADEINAKYDAFYIPLANAFRPSFKPELVALTALIQRLRIPTVVIGVGAQASTDAVAELKPIEAEIKAFCREVLARSATIGVRGAFTAAYLDALGIRAVEVIGCPSMFYFGAELPPLAAPAAVRRVALTLTPHSPDSIKQANAGARPVVEALLGALGGFTGEVVYVAQDTVTLQNELWGSRFTPESGPTLRNFLGRACAFETVCPLDVHTWIDYLASFDLSIGTRIHGTIAGVLAGIPSVLVPYDSRTRELGEYFELPAVAHEALARTRDLPALCGTLDFTRTARGHRERLERYVAFLGRNAVRHTFDPATLAMAHAAYDERLRGIRFPDVYAAHRAGADDVVNEKFALLGQQVAELNKRVAVLTKAMNAVLERPS